MKKQRTLTLRKTTIRRLTPRELTAVGGGLFEQELTLIGVSGPSRQESDACTWGCSHTCSNYETCA